MNGGSAWPSRLAGALGVVGAAVAVAGVWLAWSVREVVPPADLEPGPGGAFFLAALAFVAAGCVLAARRPANPVGWMLLTMGLIAGASGVAGLRRVDVYAATGTVDTPVAALLWDLLWLPGVMLVPLLLMVFPNGRLPGRRWRVVPGLLGLGFVLVMLGVGLRPGPLTNSPIDNPIGIGALGAVAPGLEGAGNAALALATLMALAAPLARYRRGTVVERYQLRWFLAASALVVTSWLVASGLEAVGVSATALAAVRIAPLLALPAAIVVAMVQHRLYDIDAVINKGVLYVGLATFVGFIYVAVVFGVGTLIGGRDGATVPLTVGATALAAVAFQPARQRLEQLANRAVYGQRVSPYEVLAAFTRQMSGAYPVGEAPTAMAAVVGTALRVSRCDVWLVSGNELSLTASWPSDPPSLTVALPRLEAGFELHRSDRTYPVRHDGRLLGAIGVTLAPGDRLTSAEERLLGDLAAAAWLVLDNSQLFRDLRISRHRLVAAQDTQRRRIERDLHDGAQQRLLELALTLRLAHRQAELHGNQPVAGTIAAGEMQLRATLAELRELARGIHPAILTQRGVVAAVESLAERAPLPVTVTSERFDRLPPPVEATAYFVAAEAVTNIIKHAGATGATITIAARDGQLALTVEDDGRGGADPSAPGLSGLLDRVTALEGRIDIVSPLGGGTRIEVVLPCE